MRIASRCRPGWSAGLCLLAFATVARGTAIEFQAAPLNLPEADRRFLEQALGTGVLGPAIAPLPVNDPKGFLPAQPGWSSFLLLNDGQPGATERHRFVPREGPGGAMWRYRIGDQGVELLAQEADGDLVITGVNDQKEGVATRYEPPKIMLSRNMVPGEESRATTELRVYDLAQSDRLLHSGSLDVVAVYLGAFQLNLPAGSYQAALIRTIANGRVGPAKLEDTQYHFYAPAVGEVAAVELRKVRAFGVYHSTTKIARVLAAKPE